MSLPTIYSANTKIKSAEVYANELKAYQKSEIYEQNGIASPVNTLRSDQMVQRGWGYVQGDGVSAAIDRAVSFPVAFDDANYDFVVSYIGEKGTAGAPTSRANTSSDSAVITAFTTGTVAHAATGVTVRIRDTTAAPLAVGKSYLFSWIAIGTKA